MTTEERDKRVAAAERRAMEALALEYLELRRKADKCRAIMRQEWLSDDQEPSLKCEFAHRLFHGLSRKAAGLRRTVNRWLAKKEQATKGERK